MLFIAISIAFIGYIMKEYTIQYQTEPETIAEMHRTSVKLLTGLIVVAFVLYMFH